MLASEILKFQTRKKQQQQKIAPLWPYTPQDRLNRIKYLTLYF